MPKLSEMFGPPPFVRDLLRNCPRAGTGVHHWLFCTARQLHAHYSRNEIVELLLNGARDCGRVIPLREVEAAVDRAAQCAWGNTTNGALRPEPRWPRAVNQAKRKRITKDGPCLADFAESSPVWADLSKNRSEEIIDTLFPRDALLCCGKFMYQFATRAREKWRGRLSEIQYMVPSPMTQVMGLTKDGKPSEHSEDNTGPRRFLVIEFDTGTLDEHAALLSHLSGLGPLVMAVHSGHKSLHGWFYCQDQPEEKLEKFMRYAISLGADPAPWGRSQFVRIPDGLRDDGKRQSVFYYNPTLVTL